MLARFLFDAAKIEYLYIEKCIFSRLPKASAKNVKSTSQASSWAFALHLSNLSPVRGWSLGSISVFVQTSEISEADRSLMSL